MKSLLDLVVSGQDVTGVVKSLSGDELVATVRDIGLEESGWLVSLFDKEQIHLVLDELMWEYSSDSPIEAFSYEKFFYLLESIFQNDPKNIFDNLSRFDENLLVSSLETQLLVFNVDDLMFDFNAMENDINKDLLEKVFHSHYQLELDQFLILSKKGEHWELISSIIAQLSQDDFDYLCRLLDRIAYITNEYIEDNGSLYDVLLEREQIVEDSHDDRDHRRGERGFISGARTKSFFASFEQSKLEDVVGQDRYGLVEQSYLREHGIHVGHDLIADSAVVAENSSIQDLAKFTSELQKLKSIDSKSYNLLSQELLFLMNVSLERAKMTGAHIDRSQIVDDVASKIRSGLEFLKEEGPTRHGLIKLFKIGHLIKRK